MLKGFTAKARQIQLKAILEYGYKNPDEVWKFIVRLADNEGLAVHVNSHTKEFLSDAANQGVSDKDLQTIKEGCEKHYGVTINW